MKPLHPETLKALAELICGDTTPPYRTRVRIGEFFQRVDSRFPYPDDRSSRNRWTIEQLNACNHENVDSSEEDTHFFNLYTLEAIILQLADPREYQGDRDTMQTVLGKLNRILASEELSIAFDGVHPRLQQVNGTISVIGDNIVYNVPNFARFINDEQLVTSLRARWEEAYRCMTAGAYLAAVILLGSVLEGALLHTIKNNPKEANQSSKCPLNRKDGKPKHPHEWTLNEYIDVAHDCGWIQGDRHRFSHALRESRNLIHPRVELSLKEWPDENSCRICWQVVQAAIDDLRLSQLVPF